MSKSLTITLNKLNFINSSDQQFSFQNQCSTLNNSKISVLLSSTHKLQRTKSQRSIKNNQVNFFNQLFTFPLQHIPISIIILLESSKQSQQIAKFQISKDIVQLPKKQLNNIVFKIEHFQLKLQCSIIKENLLNVLDEIESVQFTQHDLDDIDSPKLKERKLLRDFSGALLLKEENQFNFNDQCFDSLSMRSADQLNIDLKSSIQQLKLSGSYGQIKTCRIINNSKNKQISEKMNKSQKIHQKACQKNKSKKMANKNQLQLSQSLTTKSGKSIKDSVLAKSINQVIYGTALGIVSGLIIATTGH